MNLFELGEERFGVMNRKMWEKFFRTKNAEQLWPAKGEPKQSVGKPQQSAKDAKQGKSGGKSGKGLSTEFAGLPTLLHQGNEAAKKSDKEGGNNFNNSAVDGNDNLSDVDCSPIRSSGEDVPELSMRSEGEHEGEHEGEEGGKSEGKDDGNGESAGRSAATKPNESPRMNVKKIKYEPDDDDDDDDEGDDDNSDSAYGDDPEMKRTKSFRKWLAEEIEETIGMELLEVANGEGTGVGVSYEELSEWMEGYEKGELPDFWTEHGASVTGEKGIPAKETLVWTWDRPAWESCTNLIVLFSFGYQSSLSMLMV
jgi:hypothetical protein